jgi:hypothetical protein
MAERQAFSLLSAGRNTGFDESEKKVFAMSLPSLLDDFKKSSRRL